MIFNPFRSVYATSTVHRHPTSDAPSPQAPHGSARTRCLLLAACFTKEQEQHRFWWLYFQMLLNSLFVHKLICYRPGSMLSGLIWNWYFTGYTGRTAGHTPQEEDRSLKRCFLPRQEEGEPFQDPALAGCLQPQLSRDRLVLKALRSPPRTSSPSAPFTWLLRGCCALGISNFAKMLEVCY